MPIPSLQSPRRLLTPPDRDSEALSLRCHSDAGASTSCGGPLTFGAALSRLAHDLGVWHLDGYGVSIIRRADDGMRVGVCGSLQGLGWPREPKGWLLPEARGRGFALIGSTAALTHACEVFRWVRVETHMADENIAARALARRLGGEAVRRQVLPDGVERDVLERQTCHR